METGSKQGTWIAVIFATIITAVILVFGHILMFAFTDTVSLVDLSMNCMKIIAIGYIAMAVIQNLSGVMRGAGDTMTPMWISIITTVLIRVPLAYVISFLTKSTELPNGRWECIPISLVSSWQLGAFLTYFFYKKGKWKSRSL